MTELEKHLVQQFYDWEVRGRGWVQHDEPVSLEPAFRPFRYRMPRPRIHNAGQMPTLLSSVTSAIAGLFAPREAALQEEEPEEEAAPDAAGPAGDLVEIVATLPPGFAVSADQTRSLISSAGVCNRPIALEYAANQRSIVAQWAVEKRDVERLEPQIQSHLPEVTLTHSGDHLKTLFERAAYLTLVEVGLDLEFLVPLTIFQRLDPDPLLPLIAVLGSLKESECALFQVLFTPVRHQWAPFMRAIVTSPDGAPLFVNAPELVEQVTVKTASPLYAVALRLVAGAGTEARASNLMKQLGEALRAFGATEGGNQLVALRNERQSNGETAGELLLKEILERRTRRSGMILNLDELVSLAHLPSASVKHPKVVRQVRKTKPAPAHLRGGAFALGLNEHGGQINKVTLSSEERVRHTHILGAVGTGKSTLLLNSIVQDILAGEGVAVLDPHGDLIDKVISYIPTWRIPDVILFDPSDEEYPVGFNILSAHSEVERNLLASDLCAVFQRQSTSWGDQMTTVLSNAILAFLESTRGGTLADLRRFLLEDDYRKEFLTTVDDQEINYFWKRNFPQVSGKPQASIVTRLDAFLRPKAVRYMVCQQGSPLDFADVMDRGKIFLGKLSQGLIGEANAHLFGSLLVSKFQQTAIARQAQAIEDRRDFWLYIDECHNFVTPSMAAILTGTRKYRLGLILAHQELRQLIQRDAEGGGAVIGSPTTRVCFRLGEEDARKLADGFSFFEASDLVDLGTGEAICRVGRSDYDFNLRVPTLLNAEPVKSNEVFSEVRAHTRRVYARPREQVAEDYRKANAWSDDPTEPETSVQKGGTKAGKPKRETSAPAQPPPASAQPVVAATQETAATETVSTSEESPSALETPSPPTEHIAPPVRESPLAQPSAPAGVSEDPPTLEEILASEPEEETKPGEAAPREPNLGGSGSPEHIYLQRYLAEVAHELGYTAEINEQFHGVGQIDVLLTRDGKNIAIEVNVTTTPKWDSGKIQKCLAAGIGLVAFVGNKKQKIARLQKLAQQIFSAEQLTRVIFGTPEQLAAFLVANTQKTGGKTKICGYDVTTITPSGKSATGKVDQVVYDALANALRRLKRRR